MSGYGNAEARTLLASSKLELSQLISDWQRDRGESNSIYLAANARMPWGRPHQIRFYAVKDGSGDHWRALLPRSADGAMVDRVERAKLQHEIEEAGHAMEDPASNALLIEVANFWKAMMKIRYGLNRYNTKEYTKKPIEAYLSFPEVTAMMRLEMVSDAGEQMPTTQRHQLAAGSLRWDSEAYRGKLRARAAEIRDQVATGDIVGIVINDIEPRLEWTSDAALTALGAACGSFGTPDILCVKPGGRAIWFTDDPALREFTIRDDPHMVSPVDKATPLPVVACIPFVLPYGDAIGRSAIASTHPHISFDYVRQELRVCCGALQHAIAYAFVTMKRVNAVIESSEIADHLAEAIAKTSDADTSKRMAGALGEFNRREILSGDIPPKED